MIDQDRLAKLADIPIDRGAHSSFEQGACALEMVAYLAGEEHSDHPKCACPMISAFVRSWNDSLSNDDRERFLRPIIPKLVGTRLTPDVESKRSYLALDWLVRENLPAWLELVPGLTPHAAALRGLPEIRDSVSPEARKAIDAAKNAARDARAVVRAATVRDARYIAWDARDTVWDATWAAVSDAASDAARSAGVAARDARDATWDAASAVAMEALRPTVERLQLSAVRLIERMIEVR